MEYRSCFIHAITEFDDMCNGMAELSWRVHSWRFCPSDSPFFAVVLFQRPVFGK